MVKKLIINGKLERPLIRRVDCYNGCGTRILLYYNADGLCRKCKRLLQHRAIKLDAKNRRQELGDD